MIRDIFDLPEPQKDRTVCMGTVKSLSNGDPLIQFDGETLVSQKVYKRLASYSPAVNDRVLIMPISGSYVILGKII
jgi:hypothetical protein